MTKTSSVAHPYVFPASQLFQGNDGQWSTFAIRVGTPAQEFYVLPSTSSHNTVVPLKEGCNSTTPPECGSRRGTFDFDGHPSSGFMVNASTTWQDISMFKLQLDNQYDINVPAHYGNDTVGLGVLKTDGPTMDRQLIAAIAHREFFLGVFQLGIKPTNFTTDFDDPQPSYLANLREKGVIPGLGFGYTAGAWYKYAGVTASLVLGGYDQSKYDEDRMKTFQFGPDDNFDFTLGLQKFSVNNSLSGSNVPLLTDGIIANIDSTLPYFWLPVQVCDMFEAAFGLTYDETTQLYLVNDTTHARMKELKPVVSFTLGEAMTATNEDTTVSIQLPYDAFDVQASWPLMENTTNYFPLKRARNSTQYTLGRAFLQESYLSVDYERRIFNVSQAKFSSPMPTQQVIPIMAEGEIPPRETEQPTLSTAAKVGLGVGVSVGVMVALLIALVWYGRHRRRLVVDEQEEPSATESPSWAMEAASNDPSELHASSRPCEADAHSSQLYELSGYDAPLELCSGDRDR